MDEPPAVDLVDITFIIGHSVQYGPSTYKGQGHLNIVLLLVQSDRPRPQLLYFSGPNNPKQQREIKNVYNAELVSQGGKNVQNLFRTKVSNIQTKRTGLIVVLVVAGVVLVQVVAVVVVLVIVIVVGVAVVVVVVVLQKQQQQEELFCCSSTYCSSSCSSCCSFVVGVVVGHITYNRNITDMILNQFLALCFKLN